jgi:hypothetical protein
MALVLLQAASAITLEVSMPKFAKKMHWCRNGMADGTYDSLQYAFDTP